MHVIDLDFQFDCYTERFNIGGSILARGRGLIEFAFVYFRTYMVCFLKVKIRLLPGFRKKAKYSWEQEFGEEFDQMSVVL